MPLTELDSDEALSDFLSKNSTGAIVCFSASWCGPCKASKPKLEQLSLDSKRDIGYVLEHDLGDSITSYWAIRAFPSYVMFIEGKETQRVEGVNFAALQAMIDKLPSPLPTTGGNTLGGGAASAEDARAQRLARFGTSSAAAPAPAPAPASEDSKPSAADVDVAEVKKDAPQEEDVQMEDAEANNKEDVKMEDAPAVVDPAAGLDPEMIKQLTETMGFSLLRAQKGLLYGNTKTVEAAVEWILQHQDDADIDAPIEAAPAGEVKSYRCVKTGKILASIADLELYAHRTGYSDFEESTEAKKPLTPEEKAAKLEQIKKLLDTKRKAREEAEKQEAIIREKARRTMGQEMTKTREVLEKEQRKRDAQRRKREKQDYQRERQRLRAELAKDKAERMANKGKLNSKLGVDGYQPDGIQYDVDVDGGEANATSDAPGSPPKKKAAPSGSSSQKVDEYLKKIASYKAGGDGGKCLKVLHLYLKNLHQQPDEVKFRTINTDNKAFKTKVKPFVGAKQILMAAGFAPEGTSLILGEESSVELIRSIDAKVEAALAEYNK